ncbi:MAG: helix-turn-helix domain-containing protein [Candidatus Delongbacteria bacterium]|nr:helix-turn-helix domain-containing protein [Candidatus Delongbacteria bacterium]
MSDNNHPHETGLKEFELRLARLEKNQAVSTKKYLSLEEAAEYLNLSKSTLYTYSSKGLIRFFKLRGRKLYFTVNDLDRFIERQSIKSNKNGGE